MHQSDFFSPNTDTDTLKEQYVGFSGIWRWGCRLQPTEHPCPFQAPTVAFSFTLVKLVRIGDQIVHRRLKVMFNDWFSCADLTNLLSELRC